MKTRNIIIAVLAVGLALSSCLKSNKTELVTPPTSSRDSIIYEIFSSLATLSQQISTQDSLSQENLKTLEAASSQLTKNTEELTKQDFDSENILTIIGQINTLISYNRPKTDSLEIQRLDSLKRANSLASKLTVVNTAYLINLSEEELLDKEIVLKPSFMGRALKVNPDASLKDFNKVNMYALEQISLVGKPKIVSLHDKNSYYIDTQNNILNITDKQKFWANSRVLVISYK
ncbi:MAG: hypothetical protein R3Y38_00105 [Rikenellaceae bacterium]